MTPTTVCRSIDEVIAKYRDLLDHRHDMPYEMDGMVIKVNSFAEQEELGWVSRSPRWAVAWKFPPEQKKTKIEKILVSVGRTGAITRMPCLIRWCCQVRGSPTCHSLNLDEIRRKDIRQGDIALVERGGDVIPHIVKVFPEERTTDLPEWNMPKECPACGSEIERVEGEANAYCTGSSCPIQLVQKLFHFGGRHAMDIQGLGEKSIAQLLEAGLIHDIADLYELDRDKLLSLNEWARSQLRTFWRPSRNRRNDQSPDSCTAWYSACG